MLRRWVQTRVARATIDAAPGAGHVAGSLTFQVVVRDGRRTVTRTARAGELSATVLW
jgi:hypothetical protein